MKTFSQTTVSQIFQKWWHYAQFTKLERAQAKVVVAIKQQRLQRLTDVVNKHCPKQRTKRIHLTGDDGSFLTPTEETAMCVHHIATKWHGPALILPASARLGVPWWVWITGVRHHPICHRPGRMLPGPRKPATKLDNLRMLGLQEPLGKADWWLLSLSNSRFLLGGWWFLSAGQYSVHASTQSQPRYSCAGGIQFCLDLTRAFDAEPRPVPAAALDRVQSNPQLQSILFAWHVDTCYHIEVNNTANPSH